MSMEWQGKVAVVTGAGGTLCSVIAAFLAEKGMKVVLIGRTKEKLDKTAAVIQSKGGVYRIECADVNDVAALTDIAARVAAGSPSTGRTEPSGAFRCA